MEPGCCLYPAEGFGTVDDLPDSINYTDAFTSFTLTKVEPFDYGGMLVYYVADLDSEQYIGIPYEAIFNPGDCQNPEQTLGWGGGPGVGAFSSSCCLIRGLSAPPEYITDNFADTYTLTAYDQNGLVGSVAVTRVSLCLWTGVNSFGNVSGIEYLEDSSTWAASFPPEQDIIDGTKFGFQNTPVGDYGNIPGNVALTVS